MCSILVGTLSSVHKYVSAIQVSCWGKLTKTCMQTKISSQITRGRQQWLRKITCNKTVILPTKCKVGNYVHIYFSYTCYFRSVLLLYRCGTNYSSSHIHIVRNVFFWIKIYAINNNCKFSHHAELGLTFWLINMIVVCTVWKIVTLDIAYNQYNTWLF